MRLTAEEIAFYEANGYLSPVRVFDEETGALHQQEFNKIEARVGPERCAEAHRMTGRFIFDDDFGESFVWDIVSHPNLLDPVESLLGSFHLLNNTRFFCRYGNDAKKYVAWHQDLTYMAMEPPELITAWYAIDDVDEENGCLQVIPGSHRSREFYQHDTSPNGGNILNRNQEVFLDEELQSKVVTLPLRKGEATLFSGFLLHGSPPNRSSRRRCGLSIRYAPVACKPGHEKISFGILMRGSDPYGHFQQRERPY